MSESTSNLAPDAKPVPLNLFQTLLGVGFSAAIAVGLSRLALSTSQKLATAPLPHGNATAVNVAMAVRSLLLGFCVMGAAIFGIIATGVLVWKLQQIFTRVTQVAER